MTYSGYMARDFIQNSEQYLTQIDAEIQRLQQLRTQVTGAIEGDQEVASVSKVRKGMSEDGRRRVAEAQKARWAKLKKPTAKSGLKAVVKPGRKPGAKPGPKPGSKTAVAVKEVTE